MKKLSYVLITLLTSTILFSACTDSQKKQSRADDTKLRSISISKKKQSSTNRVKSESESKAHALSESISESISSSASTAMAMVDNDNQTTSQDNTASQDPLVNQNSTTSPVETQSSVSAGQDSSYEGHAALSDFINQYGMSPSAYKVQHDGMSLEEALRSTPNSMKTSGEIQTQYSQFGIN
ncbi:hypothetical protein [Latilactobacillus sakei]|uniref:hypothetical protein n=1 Tax=Latilactobacillus sakei TaxID=1599 RepID=UPI003F532977